MYILLAGSVTTPLLFATPLWAGEAAGSIPTKPKICISMTLSLTLNQEALEQATNLDLSSLRLLSSFWLDSNSSKQHNHMMNGSLLHASVKSNKKLSSDRNWALITCKCVSSSDIHLSLIVFLVKFKPTLVACLMCWCIHFVYYWMLTLTSQILYSHRWCLNKNCYYW